MNEELSNLLEQALQYASPLSVTSTENMVTDSPETTAASGLIQRTSSSNLEQFCENSLDNHSDKTGKFLLNSSNAHLNTQWCQPVHFSLTESSEKNFPDDCHRNRSNMFHQLCFGNQNLESLDHLSNTVTDYQDEKFSDIETHETEEALDSNLTQLDTAALVTEVHPDSTSGVLNDLSDITEACLQFENDPQPTVDSTVCFGTDDVKPKIKRRRRREKNPDPPPPTILPPCDICNEKSSGYHYGANTCEACKGFYRRTLKKKEVDYKCKCTPDEKEAWKRGPYKNGCPACRYEKCLAVGMSKNAIKIGRYTLNHKTRNIKKIKSIETIDSLITALTETVSASSPASDETVSTSSSTVDISELSIGASEDSFEPINTEFTCTPKETRNLGISLKEIDYIVKTLTEAHTTLILDDRTNMPSEIMKKKQTEYLEKYRLKTELFGSMRTITKEEFKEFYNTTGIDIDGRLERVDTALKYFEEKVSMVVAFAKAIPGFKDLTLDDQANLIKASRVEASFICLYKNTMRNIDMDKKIVVLPWGTAIHLDEVGKFFPADHLSSRYRFAKEMADLNLSAQEESILRALLILFTDRCKLDEPEKVDALQEKMVTCLQHLINVRPGGPGTVLYKIFNIITNLRSLTEKSMDFAKRLLIDWPMLNINSYQLVREFLS